MIHELGKKARLASRTLAKATSEQKNTFLSCLADRLLANAADILSANQIDILAGSQAGLSAAFLDRLTLNKERLASMSEDLRTVAALPDPVGEVFDPMILPNGLRVHKQRVPLGVLAVVYESRPNVTIDAAGLAIKTGNAVILRGGSETIASNKALVDVIREALSEAGLTVEAVQFIEDPDRARVMELLKLQEYIDMLIPRGGAALHEFCRQHSRIPVITGGIGICHLFVDESADLEAALLVIQNAKVQRPTVCNALDTVLVHRTIAADFLPRLAAQLSGDGVSFRADEAAIPFLESPGVTAHEAGPEDFDTEWLSLVLGIKIVSGLDEAIEHIALHSTAHSDGILTSNPENVKRFITEVDSAAVYVNASTRFTDGSQLGLGAEVAISTQRLHARGPMGLRELTTYKWVVQGDYHIRE